ncbi:HEAT repeat domain-containing protein [Natroniella acetigena]|uniref:HEAT repeat domain-containing protein n=1 Tax=Natroniella acetigena TaxID=52004 RepID=UPI00200B0743|nr:HEAT repeat domain-containing protein [Natroniella acetigena]MCK8827198.1 HEAT repeat domain-containing protein [Natroniella acetigena]
MFIPYINMLQEINFFYLLISSVGIIILILLKYFKSNSKLDYELVISTLKKKKNDFSILKELEENKIKKKIFLEGKKDLEPKLYLSVKKYLLNNGLVEESFKDLVFAQPEEKILACQVLSKVGTSQAIDYCVTALYDNNNKVKNKAIKALTDNANPKVIDAFIDYIDHCDNEVLLSMLTNAFKKMGCQALEQLKRVAFEKDEIYRVWATKLLRDIDDEQVTDLLIKLLDDQSVQVRIEAIRGLVQYIDQEQVFKYVVEQLKDNDWKVRNQAVKILGELSDPRTSSHLFELIDDEHQIIRINVCHALIKAGYEGIKYLIKATKIKKSKQAALQTLDELDIEFLMEAIQNIYGTDKETTTMITEQLTNANN